jgi:hypothetical protein
LTNRHLFLKKNSALCVKQKCHIFSFTKSENRKAEQVLSWGVGTSGSGKEVGKRVEEVNMVQILCTHVCTWKMRPIETIPNMGKEGIKENGGRGEFKYATFDML